MRFDTIFFQRSAVAALSLMAAVSLGSAAQAATYGEDAATPAQGAVAGALDSIASPDTTVYGDMLAAIDGLGSSAERADALGQLSPRNYRLLPRLAIQSMDASDSEIRGYLAERREQAWDAAAAPPPPADQTVRFMLSFGLKQAAYKQRIDRPAANSDSRSIRSGLDVSPAKGLILGATLGIDGIDANLDRSQHPRITQFNVDIGPYASYSTNTFYIDATSVYNRSYYKLRRQISWSGFSDQLRTNVSGDNAAATVEAGSILQFGALRAQPFAGLHYRYADVSGFVEHGGAAALAVAQYKTQSVRSSIGLRASTKARTGSWTVRPNVEAQWQRELRGHPDSRIEAVFAGGDTPIFVLPGAQYARDVAVVKAGLSAASGERISIRLAYSGEFAADRHVHGLAITASRRF
ncbi:autotransporter domain-containing protein [Novosphingobium sp. KA1]|uniref:autotransporter outer membrane beta-barrel domain-containing protein n=1 Tax=Novosphingobium sp. (strain KA1) TaxID=164608 RepID=UPI001F5CD50C|nr:autotransporter outer membrane beta-barrel domain-containing protein [Novosphingobium sp. KA1]